jgi:nucleotide-binding universal stress UspA family protein
VVLPMAVKLVAGQDASLRLVHVVPRPGMPSNLPLSQSEKELVKQLVERNKREAERYLEEICSRLSGESIDVQTWVEVSANPIETLHKLVEHDETDLVVLSAHGYSGCCRWPYGSVTLSFIAYGTVPLLILQDLSSERIRPSLAELVAKEQPVH